MGIFTPYFEWKRRRAENRNNHKSKHRIHVGVDMGKGFSKSHTTFMVNGRILRPGTPEYKHAKQSYEMGMDELCKGMEELSRAVKEIGITIGKDKKHDRRIK